MGRKIPEQDEVGVKTRDSATSEQIHTLLNAAGMLHTVFAGPVIDEAPKKIDGGARLAAEVTFVNICARLDAIVADTNRWTIEGYDEVIQGVLDQQKQNLQFLRAQTAAAEELNTPHFQLKPKLFRLGGGGWAAVVGDVNHLDHALVGTGSTPEEATLAFDLVFKGQLPASTVTWLTEREAALAAGQELPPFPKYETNTTMDQQRTEHPKKPKGKRAHPPRNSSDTGPDDQSGGTKTGIDGKP